MTEFEFSWLMLPCAVLGYLLGNVETAVLLSRGKFHDDVRKHGSGNAGTTNMLRVFGVKPGVLTFVGDFLKGIIAVLVGRWIFGDCGGYIAGLFAVLGHDFPAFFGLKGGKGVATTLAICIMLRPVPAVIATLCGFAVIYLTQMVSVGSLLGLTCLFAYMIITSSSDLSLVILCCVLWLLVMLRHKDNLVRIFSGTESKLFKHKTMKERRSGNNS